jgi:hypothetical protein
MRLAIEFIVYVVVIMLGEARCVFLSFGTPQEFVFILVCNITSSIVSSLPFVCTCIYKIYRF